MALLDEAQKTEIRQMIRQGTNEAFAASSAQLAAEKAEMVKGHEDMRTTTEEFVNNQSVRNAEVEKKYIELTRDIELRFTALRVELGKEFDSTKADAIEVRTLITGFEEQKRVMIGEIDAHFRDFDTKSGEMKVLIGQSETVLQQSLVQMNQIVDGALKTIHLKFEQSDTTFILIANNHQQYDALVGRQQQQQQGKGSSSERTGHPEVRGLIHDKDIRMPEFPQKPESTEMFRRWWKDVAEYRETSPAFPCCQVLFSAIRGYTNVIES